MRVWYDDIDTAILQKIKTYSAFNDPESKNLMVQTMYEYKQEEIADLEKENAEIHQKIINLKKENVELEEWKEQTIKARGRDYMDWSRMKDDWNEMNDQLTKAKELLKEFVHHYKDKTIYIENMQDLLEQVERFIKDSEVEK